MASEKSNGTSAQDLLIQSFLEEKSNFILMKTSQHNFTETGKKRKGSTCLGEQQC